MGLADLILSAMVFAATVAVSTAILGHHPHTPPPLLVPRTAPLWTIVTVAGGVIAAAIGEETLWRGFIYQGFAAGRSKPAAMALSAALFAFFHIYPLMWPSLFVSGLLLSFVYERRGRSLLAPMTMHATVNLSIALLLIFHAR